MDIVIKTKLFPAYYADFHCLGGTCRDNCCKDGWQITFNKKDYLKLRREDIPPDLRVRLDKIVHRMRGKELQNNPARHYAKFDLGESGRCPLQSEDGWCTLQRTCGENALPEVCRIFPRGKRFTPAGQELTLSPACEAVLQLLWELPEGVDFIEENLPIGERKKISPRQNSLDSWYPIIRSLCVDILQARALSLNRRMLLLGMALQDLLKMDWASPDVEGWTARTISCLTSPNTPELLAGLPGNRTFFLAQNIRLLSVMNRLGSNREPLLGELTGRNEITLAPEEYQRRLDIFNEAFGDLEYFFENLMVTTLFYLGSPNPESRESVWKEYVGLCNLYSAYRFVAVMGYAEEPTKQHLFHVLVQVIRMLLHGRRWFDKFQNEFFENDSATLAHMAILVTE